MCVCRFMSFMFLFCLFVSIEEGLFCVSNLCVFIYFILLPFVLLFWARPVGRACLKLVVWLFWYCVLLVLLFLVCNVFWFFGI